jgi:CheY-like chemotaxis protein
LSTGRRKLLVADDSPTVRKVITLTFEDEGVEVVAAGDGAEALRILRDGPPPDAILADVMMPGPDGYELCARVKSDPRLRHVPVILLTGQFEPFNQAEARRVGADMVLTKPFQSIRDLVSKVGSLIGGEPKEAEGSEERAEHAGHDSARAGAEPQPGAEAATERRFDAEADRRAASDARASSDPWASSDPAPSSESPRAPEPFYSPEAGVEVQPRAPEIVSPDHDPASSFADLGVDDEMIEARPAEAFGSGTHSAAWAAGDSTGPASSSFAEPDAPADNSFDARSFGRHESQGAAGFEPETEPVVSPVANSPFLAAPEVESVSQRVEAVANEPRQAFAARAAAAATADDALLDLGGFGSSDPASGRTADDDFILDLDDEPPFASAPQTTSAAPAAFAAPAEALSFDEPAGLDQPAAFAEAAHGEPAARADAFDFDSAPQSEAASYDAEVVREVVAEDVPPRFDSFELRDDPLDFGSAGDDAPPSVESQDRAPDAAGEHEGLSRREFIEPTVVPADEPARGAFEGEFMDGRVEGDLPRPPAVFAPAAEQETATTEAEADAAPFFGSAEPASSHTPQAVGQARTGFDETQRAGSLSAEDIEAIARRVVELMADRVVREIAWEVVPELAELHVRRKLEEERGS